jgi:hypothetical protein
MCRRILLSNYDTPTLRKQRSIWLYHFPGRHQVSIRCPLNNDWTTLTETLSGAGIIHNASTCAVESNEIRTLPELHRTGVARLDTPGLYLPDLSPILATHEMPQIDSSVPVDAAAIDDIWTHLLAPQHSMDVDTLLQIRRTSFQRESTFSWPLLVSIFSCALTILLLVTFSVRPLIRQVSRRNTPYSTQELNPVPSTPLSQASSLEQGTKPEESSQQVAFTSYSFQP